jgi:hypothetical protein
MPEPWDKAEPAAEKIRELINQEELNGLEAMAACLLVMDWLRVLTEAKASGEKTGLDNPVSRLETSIQEAILSLVQWYGVPERFRN